MSLQYPAKHIGARVDLKWKCAGGHCGKWESSEVLTTNRHSKSLLMTLCFPLRLCCQGTTMQNFLCFARYSIFHTQERSTFCSFQTKCVLPVGRDVWSKMRQLVLEILKGYKNICLCGNGCDNSLGHSAHCVYTLMEHVILKWLLT